MDVIGLVQDMHHLLTDRLSRCVVVDGQSAILIRRAFTVKGIGLWTETTLR